MTTPGAAGMKRPAHPQTLPPTGLVRTLRPGKLLSWERMKPSSNFNVSIRASLPKVGISNAGSAPPEVEHESGSPGSVGPSDVKSSLFRLPGDPGQESSRATLRSRQAEAIDAVIGSLWDQDAGAAGGQWRRESRCLRTIPRGLASVHSRHPGLSPARDPTARNSLSLRRSGTGRQPERTPRAPHPDPAPGLPRSDQESANRGFGLDGSRYNGGWLGLCRPCRPESRSP